MEKDLFKDEYYTIKELSQLFKVNKFTLYNLIKKKAFPVYRIGRKFVVPKSEFSLYLKNTQK